ncbi:hypothetical protein [Streptomyces mirabilis]|uniref:hypothetical protein n=1 Tax=Streptomyces mirabilis TaxID=68239 RepID=UPI0036C11C97
MSILDEGLSGLRMLVIVGSRGLGEATARRFRRGRREVLTASRSGRVGARRLRSADETDASPARGSRVYSGPAGHPFCMRSA